MMIVFVLAAFGLVVLLLAVYGYKVSAKTAEDYMLAGRGIGVAVMFFFALFAISSVWTFYAYPSILYRHGPGFVYFIWGCVAGFVILYMFIGPRLWAVCRLNRFLSPIEALAARYESPGLRLIVSAVLIGSIVPYIADQSLGVGLGVLRFLSSLSFLAIVAKWVYGVTFLLCLALAWGSYADYRKAKEGRLADMSLKLPDRMRGWIKALIREGASARRFILSAFLTGFAVSIVELACTGQVYLPTIVFVLGIPEWRAQASVALVLYNIMFILPLVGVFLLVYFGTTSQQLIGWMTKHTAAVKLGTTVLFLLLAGWLGYSVLTS